MLLIIFSYSCTDSVKTDEPKIPITIDIQPFSDISKEK